MCHRLGQGCVLAVVQGLLGKPDRNSRPARQSGEQLVDRAVEGRRIDDLVDQAPVGCLGRGHLLAKQQHPPGPGQADQARQQPGRSRVRAEPADYERFPERGITAGHGEVGGERQVGAQPGGPPLDTAHDREVDGVQEFDDAVRGVRNSP